MECLESTGRLWPVAPHLPLHPQKALDSSVDRSSFNPTEEGRTGLVEYSNGWEEGTVRNFFLRVQNNANGRVRSSLRRSVPDQIYLAKAKNPERQAGTGFRSDASRRYDTQR